MNKHPSFWLMLICSLYLLNSCTNRFDTSQEVDPLSKLECYKTFEEFAFGGFDKQPVEKLLPTDPWHIEAIMPKEFYGDFDVNVYDWQVSLARLKDGIPEIWLTRRGLPQSDIPLILIYRPTLNSWSQISGVIEGSDIFVKEIYLTNDGTVWGRNHWSQEYNNTPNQGPILSKYNENTNQFEFVSESPQIPFVNEERYLDTRVLLDRTDIFWIAIGSDGLYTYEPQINRTTKRAELQDLSVGVLSSASDGTIYFASGNEEQPQTNNLPFHLYEGMLMQFSPDTGEFTILEIPEEPWPIVGPPLVTKADQLWLGSVGYKDLNENRWYLVHPNLSYYIEDTNYLMWPPSPQVLLEDESGTLWFGLDTELKSGTAWFDLETGKGCMLTNLYANIVGDSQQQLWLFVEGKLYRYSLGQ